MLLVNLLMRVSHLWGTRIEWVLVTLSFYYEQYHRGKRIVSRNSTSYRSTQKKQQEEMGAAEPSEPVVEDIEE